MAPARPALGEREGIRDGQERPAARRLGEQVDCARDGRERFWPQRLYEARRVLECVACRRAIATPGQTGVRCVYDGAARRMRAYRSDR